MTRFVHIQNALDHAPEPGPNGRLFIHIRPGTYDERIYVSQWRPRTTLEDGLRKTALYYRAHRGHYWQPAVTHAERRAA